MRFLLRERFSFDSFPQPRSYVCGTLAMDLGKVKGCVFSCLCFQLRLSTFEKATG